MKLHMLIPLLIMAIPILGVAWILVAVPRRERRKAEQAMLAAQKAEKERIAALPKLPTDGLLQMPDTFRDMLYGVPCVPRTFDSRYCHLVVNDEMGHVWMGYNTPIMRETLKDCGYEQDGLHVPLKGEGESTSARVVTLERPVGSIILQRRYDVYPMWLNELGEGREWARWSAITETYYGSRERLRA